VFVTNLTSRKKTLKNIRDKYLFYNLFLIKKIKVLNYRWKIEWIPRVVVKHEFKEYAEEKEDMGKGKRRSFTSRELV